MKVNNQKLIRNWILILSVMLIGFFFVGLFIVISGSRLTKDATDSFYEYNVEEMKEQMKTEVMNRLDEIEYEKKNLLDNEKTVLKEKIQHLNHLMEHSQLEQNYSGDELTIEVIKLFEEEVKLDPEYLYFILDQKGNLLRSGTDERIEGNNLIDEVDIEGTYYVQELIKAVDNIEGVYVDYYWPKVKDGEPLKKTSYCLYIESYDLIIGTGAYHEDLQLHLQEHIYEKLQSYYENKEEYIFVHDFDSTARVSGNPDFIGTKMDSQTDLKGDKIHDMVMDIITQSGEGYASYQFTRKEGEILSEKISYIHELEGWDAYIGMGFYLDDLNIEVTNYNDIFKTYYYNQLFYVFVGLVLISLLVFAIFQRGSYLQREFMRQKDIVFQELFDLSSESIVVIGKNGKLIYENSITRKIFDKKVKNYIDGPNLVFEEVEEDIQKFISPIGKDYYVQVRKENVTFKNIDSTIYYIYDVTSQYMENSKLQTLVNVDELTGVNNRRALMNDYSDIIFGLKENETYVMGLIDIDHFKLVNDNYGHDVGDRILIKLGEVFEKRLRQHDGFYRYGGEEFVVILSEISAENAISVITEIKEEFTRSVYDEFEFTCTFSGGIVELSVINKTLEFDSCIKLADEKLYQAKSSGRNQIIY